MGHDIQESEKEEFGKKGNWARVGEGRKRILSVYGSWKRVGNGENNNKGDQD